MEEDIIPSSKLILDTNIKRINLYQKFINVSKNYLPKCIIMIDENDEILDVPVSNYSDDDLNKIALLINPDEKQQWVVKNLLNAFEFLNKINNLIHENNFILRIKNIEPSIKKEIGIFQTNENPISYSPLIIYIILVKIFGSVRINERITLNEMIFIFKFIFYDYGVDIKPEENLINSFTNIVSGLIPKNNNFSIKEDLINFYLDKIILNESQENENINENFYRYDKTEFNLIYEKFKNIDKEILKRIIPDNDVEAIIFGVILYNLNLGFANNPMEEFSRIKMVNSFKDYESRDKKFEKVINTCPWFLDTRSSWFEPFHDFLFKPYPNKMKELLKDKGFILIPIDGNAFWYSKENNGEYYYDSFFKALSSIGCYNTFYVGYHPFCKNKVSAISGYYFDDPEEAPDGWVQILSYGTEDEMTGYLLKDVILYFENVLKFEIPLYNAKKADDVYYLSERCVNQLKVLCKKKIHDDYERLEKVIKKIEGMNIKFSEYALSLRENGNENLKEGFKLLLELAWYMRAWKLSPSERLPLKSEDTCFDLEKEPELTLNVTKAILNLEDFLNEKDERSLIINAPLMIFNKPKNESEPVKFTNVVNVDAYTGIESIVTVGEQISIVKSGDGLVSCVRTSSNSFLASAYFYLVCMGVETDFDIREVDKIY